MQAPGNLLLDVCHQAQSEVLLVAPFVKLNALKRLLDVIGDDVSVQCVTRWRPDEIAAGVSDIEIWPIIRDRPTSSLLLRSDLHAKYYRGDNRTLVGSANLTNAALGWSRYPNLEILIESCILNEFESTLMADAIVVEDDIYHETKQSLEFFPRTEAFEVVANDLFEAELVKSEVAQMSYDIWFPALRHPEKLFNAYLGNFDQLGSGSRVAAVKDLTALDAPKGLNRQQFEAYIGQQLLQKPIIYQLDKFVVEPQRFGAIRAYLASQLNMSNINIDITIIWQTLMRWLTFYMPKRYQTFVYRHSEIFARKDTDNDRDS